MADRDFSPSDAHFDDEAVAEPDAHVADAGDAPEASDGAAEEIDRLQDRLLRLTAEYDNYRRRSLTDREEAVRQGRRAVLIPILDVYDDLTRSLDAAQRAAQQDSGSPSFDALSQGIELVFQKFSDALQRVGVTPIEAVGKPFDEHEHEAMMQQPAPEGTESGTVLAEIQPGYRLGDRVLRHARVIVAE
ncbi:nucleotide exchange factor GrpE [Rubrivirga marina]|uniref:Protein GrpE n=1 Tax=Rubrivirga marina TaxID=1196024 RepID=A0A271J4Q9_9BACT|nr:nucleotide exchange factor GrpE [Rubrivirga marina]PAP78044.1 nucleotide exchange factor GrpE [Rubrivirga marina]